MRSEDEYDDSGERAVSELEDVHSTLEEVHSTLKEVRSRLDDILSALKSRTDSSMWIWVLFMIFALDSWPGSALDRFTDRLWYSGAYDTDWKNVNIERRPTRCDFLHAPVGRKACSYKKSKNIFGEEERRSLVQQAQTPDEKAEASKRPNMVIVYWDKKEEP